MLLFIGGFVLSNLVILAIYEYKQEDDYKRRMELHEKVEKIRRGIIK